MAGSSGSYGKNGSEQTVVVVELPDRREFVWPSPRVDMLGWQIGDRVTYLGTRWQVVSRRNGSSDVLTFQLAADEAELAALG
jgi:hypothetical protein